MYQSYEHNKWTALRDIQSITGLFDHCKDFYSIEYFRSCFLITSTLLSYNYMTLKSLFWNSKSHSSMMIRFLKNGR